MESIPEGSMRNEALARIERLDCENSDNTLASCDPAAKEPDEVRRQRAALEMASVKDDAAYKKALASVLRQLVCGADENVIHILRGATRNDRLAATGSEAPALVDAIMSNCPVSAALSEADKAKLLQIKQDAAKEFPPSSAPEKRK